MEEMGLPVYKHDELMRQLVAWMQAELTIPAEQATFVLSCVAGVPLNEITQVELLRMAEDPDNLWVHYDELENASADFLALHLPDFVFTSDASLPVNQLQLEVMLKPYKKVTNPTFRAYLTAQQLLKAYTPHPWGQPIEKWYFNPEFVAEYQKLWFRIEDENPGATPMTQQLSQRLLLTEKAAAELTGYLNAKPAFTNDLALNYRKAAETLNVDVLLLMDAEKQLLRERDTHERLRIIAIIDD